MRKAPAFVGALFFKSTITTLKSIGFASSTALK